jgi:hypothetical protein
MPMKNTSLLLSFLLLAFFATAGSADEPSVELTRARASSPGVTVRVSYPSGSSIAATA